MNTPPPADAPHDSTIILGRDPLGSASAANEPMFAVGPFRVISELGRGGMGVVYLAEDVELKRSVALKLMPTDFSKSEAARARFRREAEAASRLDHPNICGVLRLGETDGTPWMAMRYIPGRTLAREIATLRDAADDVSAATSTLGGRDLKKRHKVALALVETIARAIHEAHDAGIVHRDLKTANVMITPEGSPVVLDFGLAHDDAAQGITQTGDVLGTPYAMAPEQVDGRGRRADRRTDVWALGVMLYELLTMRRPFDEPTREGLWRAILTRDPSRPGRIVRGLLGDVDVVVATALEKDPNRRYATAADFADDIRRVIDILPIRAKPPSVAARIHKAVRRRPAAAALIALLLIGSIVVGVLVQSKRAADRDLEAAAVRRVMEIESALSNRRIETARRALDELVALGSTHGAGAREGAMRRAIVSMAALDRAETLAFDAEADPDGRMATEALMALDDKDFAVREVLRWIVDARVRGADAATETLKAAAGDADRPWIAEMLAVMDRSDDAELDAAARPDLALFAAHELSLRGRAKEALLLFEAMIEEAPEAAGIAWAAAEEASKQIEYKTALAYASRYRVLVGALTPSKLARYALHLRRAGHGAAALEAAEQAAAMAPEDAHVRIHLATALSDMKRPDEAEAIYRALIDARPEMTEAWNGLATVANERGDLEGAREAFLRAIGIMPGYADAWINLGSTYISLKRPVDAEAAFRRALELRNDHPLAMNLLGVAIRDQRRLDEAKTWLLRALETKPNFPEATANLGSVLHMSGDVSGAIARYREALLADGSLVAARANLALALMTTNPDDAIREYRLLLEARPNDVQALLNLAIMLSNRGEHEEAVRVADRATALFPENALVWNAAGTTRTERGDAEGAARAFAKASRLDPNFSQAHINFVVVAADSRPLEALAHGMIAMEQSEQYRAAIAVNVGRVLESLRATHESHPLVQARLARLAIDDEDEHTAREHFERATAPLPAPGGDDCDAGVIRRALDAELEVLRDILGGGKRD